MQTQETGRAWPQATWNRALKTQEEAAHSLQDPFILSLSTHNQASNTELTTPHVS